MILYIIYFLLTPILWILIMISTLFFFKIRSNYFSFYRLVNNIKQYLKQHNNTNKKILLFHAASSGEYEQLKPLLRLINRKR